MSEFGTKPKWNSRHLMSVAEGRTDFVFYFCGRSALDTQGCAQGELMRSSLMPLLWSIEHFDVSIVHFDVSIVHMLDDLAQVQSVKPLLARRALHDMMDRGFGD
jgi:hypothetical protein